MDPFPVLSSPVTITSKQREIDRNLLVIKVQKNNRNTDETLGKLNFFNKVKKEVFVDASQVNWEDAVKI